MSDWLDRSLQDLAAEDPPAEALAEVRMRVLERVHRSRRTWLWWLAPTAVAAGLAVWFVPAHPAVAPQQAPVVAFRVPAPAPARPAETAEAEPVRAVKAVRPRPVARPKPVEVAKSFKPRILPTGSPDFIQIESGNPDVVILWSLNTATVNDRTGEQE